MESVGQYLKNFREKNNISLQQVHDITKIKDYLLLAIENNNFADLGGYGYAKAMILSYARAIGADEIAIISQYDKQTEKTKYKTTYKSETPVREKKLMLSTNLIYLVFLGIVITGLTLVVVYFYNQGMINFNFFTKLTAKKENVSQPVKDSLKVPAKIDTVRIKQKQVLAQKQKKPKATPSTTVSDKALADTSDYVNDLMFKKKNSPFNPRN